MILLDVTAGLVLPFAAQDIMLSAVLMVITAVLKDIPVSKVVILWFIAQSTLTRQLDFSRRHIFVLFSQGVTTSNDMHLSHQSRSIQVLNKNYIL